jgi:hypothetical protein
MAGTTNDHGVRRTKLSKDIVPGARRVYHQHHIKPNAELTYDRKPASGPLPSAQLIRTLPLIPLAEDVESIVTNLE